VGAYPQGIAFDRTFIWAADYASSTVSKLRASDGSTVGTCSTPSYVYGIAFDGANIWIDNTTVNSVSKF
jgi:hypothetical protein